MLSRTPKYPHLVRPGNGLAGEIYQLRQDTAHEFDILSSQIQYPDVYVSGMNGNDSNDGRTPSTPLASIVAAEALLPDKITVRTRIHVGRAGSGAETYAFPSFRHRDFRENVVLIGDGAGQSGAAGVSVTEVLVPTVAGVGSSLVQVSGTGWTAGAFEDLTIEILSGLAAGNLRSIASNTTTAIIPSNLFSAAVNSTDLFRITRPTVLIGVPDVAVGESVLIERCGTLDASPTIDRLVTSFSVANIGFTPIAPTGTVGFVIKSSAVVFLGVELAGTTTIQIRVDGSSLSLGTNGNDATRVSGVYGCSDIGALTSLSWLGWGLNSPGANSASSAHSFSSGVIDGYVCTTRGVTARDGCRFTMRGGSLVSKGINPALQATNLSLVYLLGGSISILLEGLLTTAGGVCWAYDNSKIAVFNVRISGGVAGLSGLVAQYNGSVEVAGGLTGTCGGYGMLAMFGGVIRHSGALGGLSGTLGVISVDNHSPSSITNLSSSGKMAYGHGQIVRI